MFALHGRANFWFCVMSFKSFFFELLRSAHAARALVVYWRVLGCVCLRPGWVFAMSNKTGTCISPITGASTQAALLPVRTDGAFLQQQV
jgi:hypothetical protein